MPLPTGPAVTFLFTDIEGSTRLERLVGSEAWAGIVARHDALLREAIESNGGVVVKTEGDAFFAAFDRPASAAVAAVAAQRSIASATWPDTCEVKVRMGLHLGEGRLRVGGVAGEAEDYVGIDVNYAARIAAAGNGGQIVLSQALVDALGPTGLSLGHGVARQDEGLRAVKDFDEPLRLHRVVVEGAADDPRPLRTIEPPSNLPGDVTELVGRDDEIVSLRQILDSTRILTLTGPGGSGKTRLALGVAQSVRDRFPHGTWFVDLASVSDAGMLEPAIASTLGLRDSADHTMAEALKLHLRERTTLLSSTTSSSCSLKGPMSWRRSPVAHPRSGVWSRAASSCASVASAGIQCRRSILTPAFGCSRLERRPSALTSRSTARCARWSARSASASSGCRLRSSSPRRASAC